MLSSCWVSTFGMISPEKPISPRAVRTKDEASIDAARPAFRLPFDAIQLHASYQRAAFSVHCWLNRRLLDNFQRHYRQHKAIPPET